MAAMITFFPVGNGDMTLITLDDGTRLLIDVNIRSAADDPDDDTCDVAQALRKRLKCDARGRPYVDAFVSSHPDKDHCTGLQKHFHLGPLAEYNFEPPEGEEMKIVIQELWSSPMVFRRASKTLTLCDDAKALLNEARRRVRSFRETGQDNGVGERIRILGEDERGKTDGLDAILVKVDERFSRINGRETGLASMYLLAPLPKQEDEATEDMLAKNRSSVILQFSLAAGGQPDACLFLTGGDAEVAVWEVLWGKHRQHTDPLRYDLLLAPHHCSWHTLSWESWGDTPNPKVSPSAKAALSQAREGAFIVSSSKPIKPDEPDPPCVGAKQEYEAIVKKVGGEFFCTGEYPDEDQSQPLEFTLSAEGPQPPAKKQASRAAGAAISTAKEPRGHG